MNSPLATIAKQLRRLPWNKKYWGGASLPQQSELDHIAWGAILAQFSIILGMHWAPLYWLYLATWVYHVVFIELILDTFWKKKNNKIQNRSVKVGDIINFYDVDVINWPKVWAQVIERSVGFVVVGLIALVLFVIFQFVSVWVK